MVAVLAMAATRTPGRREAQACLLRLATFVLPFWAGHALRMLGTTPAATGSALLRAGSLAGLVLYTTGTLPSIALALGRPVRLWLQLLVQVVVVVATLPRTDQVCRTPAFQYPASEQQLGAIYEGMRCLLLFTPLPTSLMREHGAHGRCRWAWMAGEALLWPAVPALDALASLWWALRRHPAPDCPACRCVLLGMVWVTLRPARPLVLPWLPGPVPCRCVLGMVQLTLGLWIPLMASAALEARAYRRWQQTQAPAQQQLQRQLQQQHEGKHQLQKQQEAAAEQQQGDPDPFPWGQQLQLRVYREVNAMLDGEDLTWPALLALGLGQTWDLLALATLA